MIRFRREGSELVVEGSDNPLRFDLVELATYYSTHSNNDFHSRFGFDWPYSASDATAILKQNRIESARRKGTPSQKELVRAIKLHDIVLDRIAAILQAADPDASSSDGLSIDECASLDSTLQELADRVSIEHPNASLEWSRPGDARTSAHINSMFAGHYDQWSAIRAYESALLKSKAFFASFLSESANE